MIEEQYIKNPEVESMKSLTSGSDFYTIPIYQRSYSWDHHRSVAFLNDMILNTGEQAHKFCGSMIYKVERGGYHIVDGQQRMITSMIFISALRDITEIYKDLYKDEGKEINQIYLDMISNLTQCLGNKGFGETKLKPRVTVGKIIKKTFQEIVLSNKGWIHKQTIPITSKKSKTEQNIVRNYRYIYSGLDDYIKNDISNGVLPNKSIQNIFKSFTKIHFIKIEVESDRKAYEVFITVNSKNDPLTSFDLTKTLIFKEIDATLDEDNKWAEMEQNINNTQGINPTQFLRYYWVGKYSWATDRHLFASITYVGDNKSIKQKDEKGKTVLIPVKRTGDERKVFFENLIDDLNNASKVLSNIINLNEQYFIDLFGTSGSYGTRIISTLKAISRFDVKQCYIYILALILNAEKTKHNHSQHFDRVPRTVLHILRKIEIFTFKYQMLAKGLPSAVENNVYSKLAIEFEEMYTGFNNKNWSNKWTVHRKQNIIKKLDDIIDKYFTEKELSVSNLVANIQYQKKQIVRYILEKINQYTYNQPSDFNYDATLEHILPQNPKKWKLTKSDVKEYVHSIGNIIYLDSKLNSSLNDASFKDKVIGVSRPKDDQINKLSDDKTPMNQELFSQLVILLHDDKTWDRALIRERAIKLGEEFNNAYNAYEETISS